jgi:SpoIID/LytB domain protein
MVNNNGINNKAVYDLIDRQLAVWQQAKDNFEALSGVGVKEVTVGGFPVKIQFNPARIVSSAAKVDPKTIKERKCFLCAANRPAIQEGLPFMGKKAEYSVLINPFPIFPKHLTVPDVNHVNQTIEGEWERFEDMLSLSESLDEFLFFYNGPKCGASAPDHMHFQGGNKGFLPLEYNYNALEKKLLCATEGAKVYAVENYMRGILTIEATDKLAAVAQFRKIYNCLEVKEGEWEPMLNLLAWVVKENNQTKYISVIFLREKHRPSHYFAEGDANILLSPASVDMGGVFITPLEKDFNKVTEKELVEIADEIQISNEFFGLVKNALREQPMVSVGIMSEKEISFELNNAYNFTCPDNAETFEVKGPQTAVESNGKVLWDGKEYTELVFTPKGIGTFWLRGVTIGVNFHWERKEDQKFGSALKIIVEHGKLTAVNVIGVEDYLTSVISSEMSATASPELLKAHAVISRSWLLAQIEKNKEIVASNSEYSACTQTEDELVKWYDREDHTNFDVCADDHCQRYQGLTRASTLKVREAIEATWGELLMDGNKICDARFSKCCGGAVEEFQYCWEPVKYSYLVKLRDGKNTQDLPDLTIEENAHKWIMENPEAFCNTTDKNILSQVLNNYDQETVNFYRWKEEYTVKELSELVYKRSGVDYGEIIDLIPVERGTSGRLVKLKIVGTKKTMTIGKELEIRRTLSTSHLYSSAFVVEKTDGKFILYGAGWGHGVGLCQIGAAVMGEQGYKYKEILLHYFVGASIENRY